MGRCAALTAAAVLRGLPKLSARDIDRLMIERLGGLSSRKAQDLRGVEPATAKEIQKASGPAGMSEANRRRLRIEVHVQRRRAAVARTGRRLRALPDAVRDFTYQFWEEPALRAALLGPGVHVLTMGVLLDLLAAGRGQCTFCYFALTDDYVICSEVKALHRGCVGHARVTTASGLSDGERNYLENVVGWALPAPGERVVVVRDACDGNLMNIYNPRDLADRDRVAELGIAHDLMVYTWLRKPKKKSPRAS